MVSLVQQAIEILSKAKKPVFLVGSQACLPPVPAEKLSEALEVIDFFYFVFIFISKIKAFLFRNYMCPVFLEAWHEVF